MICIFVCTYGIIKQEFFKMIYNFYISVDLHIDRSFILTRVICYLIKKNKLCSKYKLIPFLKIIILYYIILYYIILHYMYSSIYTFIYKETKEFLTVIFWSGIERIQVEDLSWNLIYIYN